ncbi:MAG: family 78 glycoside hydrolase catalytic domain [Candidatus Limivivens sp.]|nr:family 78 glycoside hydrolase catalytic domain [Candidatus Limivivens sp.]
MEGKWIWTDSAETWENQRGCFGALFLADAEQEDITLEISASTRYIVYLNGEELGRGPVRSGRNQWFYDVYSLDGKIRTGENFLAVRVWSYGWSTYQTVHAPGGVIFEVRQGEGVLAASGRETRAALDLGHQSFAPKRNVNLGFTDYYDARKFDGMWMEHPEILKEWKPAREIPDVWGTLAKRDIRPFTWKNQYPEHIVAVQQVKKGCQQITVNTRRAFFGDRADANETIFSGLLGFVFESPEEMDGIIAFPNRTWNGIIGDFKIDGMLYPVSNANRSIPVHLGKGKHLFLMQISGKYDDLYCHLELEFPCTLELVCQEGGVCFFTAGPTQQIIPMIDGFHQVYGGLDEFNRMEQETKEHCYLFDAGNLQELQKHAAEMDVPFRWVEPRYVFRDAYLLSLARTEKVVAQEAASGDLRGILWANDQDMVLYPPEKGDYRRVIVDLGDLYVGSFEFQLQAEAGTIVDVYCFENMYEGEIDYTIGLNNGFRYICRKGWQRYRCMTRMGARYAMITVRETEKPARIRDFHIRHMTYAVAKSGEFACDDFLLNRIWEMCCHTHELCLEDSFTDCPTYEQAFWIGDAQMTALINACVFGDYELIRHNLELAVTAGENTKLLNALTPTDWNTSIPMWMMNWIISIQQYIDVTGDESVLERLYGPVKDTLDYYEGFVRADGGFLISAWNMMDWAAFDIHNYGVVTGQQAILAWCYELGAGFAKKLGFGEDAEHFRSIRGRLLQYIDEKMWDSGKQCFLDGWSPEAGLSKTSSIQTHVFLHLYEGILDEKKRTVTENYLTDPPEYFAKVGSPFMLYYLHACLLRLGKTEEVLADIRGRWGEMLHYDSTTCWEVFPGFYENSRTRSYCHSWSAAPMMFCLEQVLGVRRTGEGWTSLELQVPKQTGSWCRGALPTPFGVIRASWERKEKRYRIQVPAGIWVDASRLEGWQVEVTLLENSSAAALDGSR